MTRSSRKRANRNARELPFNLTFRDPDTDKFTLDSVRRLATFMKRSDREINYLFTMHRMNERLREQLGVGRVRPRNPPRRYPLPQSPGEYRAPNPDPYPVMRNVNNTFREYDQP